MTLEEVARHCAPIGGAPDTEVFLKIFKPEYQVEISYFLSGEHDTRGGGARDAELFRKILKQEYLVNEQK